MVATLRVWNHDLNYAIVGATLLAQYQDFIFRIKQWYLAAGWTITRSCDSAAAGSVGDGVDRWIASTNIVVAAAGTAHSWIIFQSPAGTSRIFALIDCADATPATPDTISYVEAPTDFGVAGTTLNRPTNAQENAITNVTILSSTSVVPRTFHGWRDDQGSLFITGITNGQGSPYMGLAVAKLQFGEPALIQPWFSSLRVSTTNPGGAFSSALGGAFFGATWRAFATGGAPVTDGRVVSPASETGLWVAGVSNANSRLADFAIDGMANSATLGGYFGRFIDVRLAGALTPSGASQAPQDPDAIVRKAIGSLWLPTPTGTVLQF